MVKRIVIKKRKYVQVRMPLEAYNNYLKRQEKLERVAKKITRKVIRIPLTKVFMTSSIAPINLSDEYVFGLTRRKKKK